MFKKITRSADYLSTDALEIILTGAFKTDVFLNFSETTTKEYQSKQKAVKDELSSLCSGYEWEIPDSGEGQKFEMGAQGTGKAFRPPYYIECVTTDYKKTIKCNDKFRFAMNEIKIKFYEFGFATLSVSIKVVPKCPKSKNKLRVKTATLLKSIDNFDDAILKGKVKQINEMICQILEKYENAIIEENIPKFDIPEKDLKTAEVAYNIISLHRIFQYKVAKDSKVKIAQRNFDKIAQLSGGEWETDDCFSHFVGVANSAIIYSCSGICDHNKICSEILKRYLTAYKTVLETANAYYFIAEGITNYLADHSRKELESLNKEEKKRLWFLKIWLKPKRFNQLDEYTLLISNFFGALNEFKVNLNHQGKSVWDRMDEIWASKKTISILENQQRDSSSIFNRISNYNAQKFQWILNIIATAFTVIGAISLVQISQSEVFHWREIFIIQGHTDNFAEFVAKGVNWFGSILAALLVLVVIVIIIIAIILFICWTVMAIYRKVSNR